MIPKINGELRKRVGTRSLGAGYVNGQDNKIQAMLYYDTPVATALIAFANGVARYYDGVNWQDVLRRRPRGHKRSNRCRSTDGHGVFHRFDQGSYPII